MIELRNTQTRGRTRFWMIDVNDNIVSTIWGDITDDGARNQHGETADTKEGKGKVGTKSFTSAADNAQFHYSRLIRKKMDEGYVEVGLDGRPLLGEVENVIDHVRSLPKNLCFSKPKNGVQEHTIDQLDLDMRSVYTRKINGMMIVAHVMEDGTIELHNRRMDIMTEHFPHLVNALGPNGLNIPPKTIMLFEGFLGQGSTKRELMKVQSVMRSLTERALTLQKEKDLWMKFCLLRMPFLRGEHLEGKMPMGKLINAMENDLAEKFIQYRDPEIKGQFLFTMDVFTGTAAEARSLTDRFGYEGWVGYDKELVLGDKSYSFTGKPNRSNGCFKLKPDEEDDFIAYWNPDRATKERPMGSWGTGKNQERVGTLSLYQIGASGTEVYICEVGTGLSDQDRTDLCEDPSRFPITVQVKFEERFYISQGDKTNALHHPRVLMIRTDKAPSECVNSDVT